MRAKQMKNNFCIYELFDRKEKLENQMKKLSIASFVAAVAALHGHVESTTISLIPFL